MKRLLLTLLAVFTLLSPLNSFATDPAMPTFNTTTGVVNIPSLQIEGAGTYYSVQLQQAQGLEFSVTGANSSTAYTVYTASYNTSTGAVSIPYLAIDGDTSSTTYAVTMQQQRANFGVTGVNLNGGGSGGGGEQVGTNLPTETPGGRVSAPAPVNLNGKNTSVRNN